MHECRPAELLCILQTLPIYCMICFQDTGESYDDEEDDLSYIEDDMANGVRSRDGVYFQDDEYDYMHNHTLTPQHLMPLEEEDNDGAILMLQGAQRGKSYSTVEPRYFELSGKRKKG